MKYITYLHKAGWQLAVLFPEVIDHNVMAETLPGKDQLISAGFVKFFAEGAHCSGKSISLNLESRLEDEDIINRMGYNGAR